MAEEHVSVSFVARIWLETGRDGGAVWRGHIKHVQGDEARYFRDLAELGEFLERISGIPGPATPSRSRRGVSGRSGATAARKRKP